ncbi:MAG: alkaline phosphatase, partial [Paramuribaculum sp.]|nr:alkaline phosphatase [Paramuribaculum sp.]
MTAGVAAALSVQAAEPRYIFYFIGDGMGMGQVMSARTYAGDVLGRPEAMVMMQFPFAGMLETRSASSTVTDSAAAGTALACGKKTDNGMLGVESDTTSVSSIATILHDAGWGVGLVTSVAPDDATPGAFYAHVPSRGMFAEIGRHAAQSGFVFIGGSAWRG